MEGKSLGLAKRMSTAQFEYHNPDFAIVTRKSLALLTRVALASPFRSGIRAIFSLNQNRQPRPGVEREPKQALGTIRTFLSASVSRAFRSRDVPRAGSRSLRKLLAFQAFTQKSIHYQLGLALKLRRCQGCNNAERVVVLPNNAVENLGPARWLVATVTPCERNAQYHMLL